MAARPDMIRVLAAAVVLLVGAGLGALRVTPSDEGGDDQASGVIDVTPSTSTTVVVVTTTTLPVATTAAPTTAAPGAPTSRLPLSPLPPAPTTTAPPATTAPPPPTQPNRPPAARPDQAETTGQNPIRINVLLNDSDPDGNLDAGTVAPYDASEHAIVGTTNDPGVVYYQPKDDFRGTDHFRYQVCDTRNACSQTQVTVFRR